MGSKQVCLFLTVGLVFASMSLGISIRQGRAQDMKAALKSLEVARLQLVKNEAAGTQEQAKVLSLIEEAIQEVRASLSTRG